MARGCKLGLKANEFKQTDQNTSNGEVSHVSEQVAVGHKMGTCIVLRKLQFLYI